MRETLRGALLSALVLGAGGLLASPVLGQGGESGPVDCQDPANAENELCGEGEEITVTAPPPELEPPEFPVIQPPPPEDPEPPPEETTTGNPCLLCHVPHTPDKPKQGNCSLEILALSAAADNEDGQCQYWPLLTMFTPECKAAQKAHAQALEDFNTCSN